MPYVGLTPEQIRACDDIDILEYHEEVAYNCCLYYNDCSVCSCWNYNDKCDLTLLSNRLHELRSKKK